VRKKITNRKIDKATLALMILAAALIIVSGSLYYKLYLQNTPREVQEQGSIRVCFTIKENCTEQIVSLIAGSSYSQAALYDVNEPGIIAALREKNAQVLVHSANYKGFGEPVTSKGLMHNKFFLIYNYSTTNDNVVITGSANPTNNDLYKNSNNVIYITSGTLFKNYKEEFDEISSQIGHKQTSTPFVRLESASLKNYFCPDDGCEDKVLAELLNAKQSIHFMVFSFTSDPIGRKLALLSDKIEVKGLFDKGQVASNKEHSEYQRLAQSSARVSLKKGQGKLHHKVFIIDGRTVITGSYNPTSSGTLKNDENILIIESPEIAASFIAEFQSLWDEEQS
jgi:phosphatidylserine/phosphatidylglycerophosphate/cardiolipin synthase-like enzyme